MHSPLTAFVANSNTSLYYPTPMKASLSFLFSEALFSSSNVFILHVTSLHHTPSHLTTKLPPDVAMQDAYVVLPPNKSIKPDPSHTKPSCNRPAKIKVGNSNTLARRIERREEEERHEENSIAFRERMERLGQWGYDNWGGYDHSEGDWICQCELDCGGQFCMGDGDDDDDDDDDEDEDEEDEDSEDDEEDESDDNDEDDEDDESDDEEPENWRRSVVNRNPHLSLPSGTYEIDLHATPNTTAGMAAMNVIGFLPFVVQNAY
jgi:hypothetical protein